MKAIVVYESLWGNTAAVAHAIAEGIGPDVPALSTAEATGVLMDDLDLIVTGAPLLAFRLPTENVRNNLGPHEKKAPTPPDLSHPSMRSWLKTLPEGTGRSAAFETGFTWSPGSAPKTMLSKLERAGYAKLERGRRFIVEDTYGPLRDGELELARAWGEELANAMK